MAKKKVMPTPVEELTIEMLRCLEHNFKIIRGVNHNGNPVWDCALCHRKKEAN